MAEREGAGSELRRESEGLSQGPPVGGSSNVDRGPVVREREAHDERLLQAVAGGDREALGALYDRFAGEMLALGRHLLGEAREAEDLVHDVFLEVWHRAGDYDRMRGSVRTWLMLRLRSRALDRRRSAQRAALLGFDELKRAFAVNVQRDTFVRRNGELYGELADLPSEQRVVLELGYFLGYSCTEIARQLEIPLGTVKSRMSRALSVLRSRFHLRKTHLRRHPALRKQRAC